MIINEHVLNYMQLYRDGKIKLNEERVLLLEYLERDVFSLDTIEFNDDMIDKCIRFGEKWYFDLTDTDKFLIAFVFLYFKGSGRLFYRKYLWLVARGFGKNGKISLLVHFFLSELHGIPEYNVSLVANSEEQAKTSFDEVYNAIGKSVPLSAMFKRTKTMITSKRNASILKFRTSNGDTKDGLRDGCVVFDEIHRYESNKDTQVHISGLGKKKHPREFYIGTDGYVRDGFLDGMKELALRVMNGEAKVNALFPFICKLDDEDEMHDPDNWEKSNPMLCHPRSEYAQGLYETIQEEYENLIDDPSTREEFMTKRMNYPMLDLEKSVATLEEIQGTNQIIPSLEGRTAVGSIDYASIRDFTAVGLLFRDGDQYVFLSHSFARKETVDKYYGYSIGEAELNKKRRFAPIRDWEREGLITILDEPTIGPEHIVNWFVKMREMYDISTIVADNFRIDLVKKPLAENDFNVDIIRNPRAIHSLLAPRIESAFAKGQINFGNNPLMRWYTGNVLVKIKNDGNKEYLKKDPIRRKTDGFQAFVHAMFKADEIDEGSFGDAMDALAGLDF